MEHQQILGLSKNAIFDEEVFGFSREDLADAVSWVDPRFHLVDPLPDIEDLLQQFDQAAFGGEILKRETGRRRVKIVWGRRMYTNAGVTDLQTRNGTIVIRLSIPILQGGDRGNIVRILLEMIHAYHYHKGMVDPADDYGEEFLQEKQRLEKLAGIDEIFVEHKHVAQVPDAEAHVWECSSKACRDTPPFYYGMYRTWRDRGPDIGGAKRQIHTEVCGGTWRKIRWPVGFKPRRGRRN
ncbi:DNA-dependent metalloprotease dvc-1-like isoform X2 [Diprion similis]|uniref:DNA-dependent metalloprotease dvc-1-like isoform X2 n=1 Tax=Diprion similis TaxID=362088 RepID=UPI001EF764BA|nr:DNA-dependent metalloprotease dvc-1-like isoform X2 [Diprion similis]